MVINNVKNDSAQKFVWLENGVKQFVNMTSSDFQASECSETQYYKGSTTKRKLQLREREKDRERQRETEREGSLRTVITIL